VLAASRQKPGFCSLYMGVAESSCLTARLSRRDGAPRSLKSHPLSNEAVPSREIPPRDASASPPPGNNEATAGKGKGLSRVSRYVSGISLRNGRLLGRNVREYCSLTRHARVIVKGCGILHFLFNCDVIRNEPPFVCLWRSVRVLGSCERAGEIAVLSKSN
jgi:hypothetical protein